MDMRALRIFLTVADTLSFSRSSEQLHVSLSAVSRAIQRLEQEVGQQLLERDNRSVRLSPAGREFRAYARKTLAEWQQLRLRLNAESDIAGEIRVFCSVTASYSILAPVLEAFRAAYPGVEIMLHTGDQAEGVGRVIAGQDDVAVTARPDALPETLAFLPLQESPLVFCAPTAECAVQAQLADADTGDPGFDWSALPFIVPERGLSKSRLDAWFRGRGITPRVYAHVAGHEAIVAMVSLGLGVGVVPEIVLESSALTGRIRRLPLAPALQPIVIGLCTVAARLQSPPLRALWEVAARSYPQPI
jgi:LysR family positive regulator for ilvC